MTKACNAKSVMLPHSRAKVEFYQKYLELYLIILSAAGFAKEINIYDVFCGRGIYDDGGVGSAIRAYKTILKVRKEHPSDTRIILHLNDKKETFIKNIKEYIDTHYGNVPAPCQVVYTHRDAIDLLKEINANSLMSLPRQGVVNFFFIDPYGYKGITRDVLYNIMSRGSSEILLFLPVSFMHRFTHYAFNKKANRGAHALRKMIDSFFPPNHPIRSDEPMNIDDYIDNLTEAFGNQCLCYTASYSIERGKGNKFALFFFSHNAKGFENILNIKRKLVDAYGFGYHLAEGEQDLFRDHFKEVQIEKQKNECRTWLTNLLAGYARTNSAIYTDSLKRGYLPQQVNEVLRELQDNGQLFIFDLKENKELKKKNKFNIKYSERRSPSLLIQALCEPQK